MSYNYSNGDGVGALNPDIPNGSSYFSELAPAIRQIKAYLADPQVGPAAKIAAINTLISNIQNAQQTAGAYPVGTVMYAARSSDVGNWLLCDGRELSRTTYSALFNVLQVLLGAGDKISTFNIPDLRGRVIIGNDYAAGRIHKIVGDSSSGSVDFSYVGSSSVALTIDSMPRHFHEVDGYGSGYRTIGPGAYHAYDENPKNYYCTAGLAAAGADKPHNNVQTSLVLNAFIKVL